MLGPSSAAPQLPEDATQGVTGFCNDMTIDADGNLYATDSWYPRILRLPAGGRRARRVARQRRVSCRPVAPERHRRRPDVADALRRREPPRRALLRCGIEADGSAGHGARDHDLARSARARRPEGHRAEPARHRGRRQRGWRCRRGCAWRPARRRSPRWSRASTRWRPWRCARRAPGWSRTRAITSGMPPTMAPTPNPPFRLVEVPLDVGAGAGIIEMSGKISSPRA